MRRILSVKAIAWIIFLSWMPLIRADAGRRTQENLVIEEIPEIPPPLAERMLQYQNVRKVSFLDWDSQGDGLVIGTRFGETTQLHWVGRPLGMRRQLTFFDEPVASVLVRPIKDRQILFLMDKGGAENYQIYLYRSSDGQTSRLTDGISRHESARWSRDGRFLAYTSTARNGKDFDIYLLEPDQSPAAELLIEAEGQWSLRDWSPDGSKILLIKDVSINESHPYILEVKERRLTRLFKDRGVKIAYGGLAWGAKGRGVYFTSDELGEFQQLGYLDLTTKKVAWITREAPWNIDSFAVSLDGRHLAFCLNEEGLSSLYLMKASGRPVRVKALPMGVINGLNFSPDGRRLGIVLKRPTASADAYVIETNGRRVTRWTQSEMGGLAEENFTAPELIRYSTFDLVNGVSRRIPAFFYKPKSKGPHPVVIVIHGGPEAQARPEFKDALQYWINEMGIAVLEPNVRGSDGYGKSYLMLDNGFNREDSIKDIGAMLDWIKTRPDLDSFRVAVFGGSYGGYMALASLARYGDRLRAGVESVGISNFVTFLENTKEYRRDLRRVEYGDERDPEMRKFLLAISPITLAKQIRSPLFVIQGANDPRVPQGEAEQIVKAVRNSGKPVWYLLAQDEGHGFAKKSNRDFSHQAVALFWEQALLPKEK
ncbi:MAG: S9 family peptidase [Elusimicrobia bacterium]|nr:S9 family peptidase [Elusimicrobiota bacterium]